MKRNLRSGVLASGLLVACTGPLVENPGSPDAGSESPDPDAGDEELPDGGAQGNPDGGGSSDGDPGAVGSDVNGVEYLPIAGYRYVADRFDWDENFRSDGSMRHDFHNAPDSNQCVLGYFFIDGPDDEEISVKLASGPHNDTNPTWADTYDLGVTNFIGDRSRLRYEDTHPSYSDGPSDTISIGDIRNKWVGAMGCKVNVDSDGNGEPDAARVVSWVDPTGLDGNGAPNNGWVVVFDHTIDFADIDLKSPAEPYVVTIGEADQAQATIRIDEQGADYDYKFVAYRKLEPL
jgi:hypothetical protein